MTGARACALIALVTTGCAFALSGPPSDASRRLAAPDCTDSSWRPTIDVLLAAYPIFLGAWTIHKRSTSGAVDPHYGEPLIAIGIGTLFLASALYGQIKIRRCRSAHRAWDTAGRSASASDPDAGTLGHWCVPPLDHGGAWRCVEGLRCTSDRHCVAYDPARPW